MRLVNGWLFVLFLVVADLSAFYFSLTVSYFSKVLFLGTFFGVVEPHDLLYFLSLWWMPLVLIVVFSFEGLYGRRLPFWSETQRVTKSVFLSFLMLFTIISLDKLSASVSRLIFVETGLLSVFLIPTFRHIVKPLLHRWGLGTLDVVLIGGEEWVRLVSLGLTRDHYMGIRPMAWICLPAGLSSDDISCRTGLSKGGEFLSEKKPPTLTCLGAWEDWRKGDIPLSVRGAVVAAPSLHAREVTGIANELHHEFRDVYIVPNVAQVNLVSSDLIFLFYEEIFLLGIRNSFQSRLNRNIKSVVDWLLALILFLIFLFPGLIIGLLIRLSSPGPVIFTQKRYGYQGRTFSILKFRTMYSGAQESLEEILANNPDLKDEYEKNHKLKKDPRMTAIGRWLRSTSLDELPQIMNVLRREMSLVGPRPDPRPDFEQLVFQHYGEAVRDYLLVRPGITGLWQVTGRNDRPFDVRVRLDLWYIRNWSLWLDIMILFRTIGVVLLKKGSY
ncbi:MAG: exopolysaccharide biosynthesis polyprenyl glycosylphosphotransferase [Leptospirillum sp.]